MFALEIGGNLKANFIFRAGLIETLKKFKTTYQ
jgi:hypothetical protein